MHDAGGMPCPELAGPTPRRVVRALGPTLASLAMLAVGVVVLVRMNDVGYVGVTPKVFGGAGVLLIFAALLRERETRLEARLLRDGSPSQARVNAVKAPTPRAPHPYLLRSMLSTLFSVRHRLSMDVWTIAYCLDGEKDWTVEDVDPLALIRVWRGTKLPREGESTTAIVLTVGKRRRLYGLIRAVRLECAHDV